MTGKRISLFIIIGLFWWACEENLEIDTDKNVYYDDISDITYLNGYFYSTNFDLSGNSGSQIDLLKFELNPDSVYFITDAFNLDMNGQGYLAMTSDGNDLYLQSRNSYLLIKCSPTGEKAFVKIDSLTANWQPCGLGYQGELDSLIVLYRNLDSKTEYRMRILSKNGSTSSTRDEIFQLNFADTTHHGVYSLVYNNSSLYLLGVDTTMSDQLITLDFSNLNVTEMEMIPDSTVVGLAFFGNDLYLSYREKRIEKWE